MRNFFRTLIVAFLFYSASSLAEIRTLNTASELKNRFRIDHFVSHITLFVQREFGTAPVIIVLPHGEKWYANRHPENVKWVAGETGDIIYIPKPLAGPWQLLGRIVDGSVIDKVSEVNIQVEDLPEEIFQGERLKVMAHIDADEQIMRLPGLDYLVKWDATLNLIDDSTDDSKYSEPKSIGDYKDNGHLLDEQPDDGIFTSNFNFDLVPGNYHFAVTAKNEVFQRQHTSRVKILGFPVVTKLIKPIDDGGFHKLEINTDVSKVNLTETHIEYSLEGPVGFTKQIVVNVLTDSTFEVELPKLTRYGSYLLTGRVASSTLDGREILFELPDINFNLFRPEPKIIEPTAEELKQAELEKAKQLEDEAKANVLTVAIITNFSLLIVGVVILILWRRKKARALLGKVKEQSKVSEKNKMSDVEVSPFEIDLTMPEGNHKNS